MKSKEFKSWGKIEKAITRFKKKQLLELIKKLYHLSSANQLFFQSFLSKQEDKLKPYKKIIQDSIHPYLEDNEPLNIENAQNAVTNYKLATNDTLGQFELLCFFVECGINFISSYSFHENDYFEAIFVAFEDAVNIAIERPENEQKRLQKRLYELIDSASYTGYGFQSELDIVYKRHFD